MKFIKSNFVLIATILFLLLALLAGCTNGLVENNGKDQSLESIVEKLCENEDVPPYEAVRLDETNFEFFCFVPYNENLSAVAADALVNITPHSVVVIKAEDGSGADIAKQVFENADPNKWLCVRAETVNVAYTDHYVVLIMSDKDTAAALSAKFKGLADELDGMDMTLLSADNPLYE